MTPPFLGLGLGMGGAATRRTGGFSPLDLSPALWLDASQLGLADAASVTTVPDLSGNSRDATNSGTAPVFDAVGPNGKPWILSAARTLLTPSFDHWPSKRGTWFVVYSPDATVSTNQTFFGSFNGGASPVWVAYNTNETGDRYFFGNAFGTSPARLQGDLGGEVVIRCVRRTSNTAWDWWRSTSKQWEFTLADVALASNPLRIGQLFSGRIGEVIGYGTNLSNAEVQQVADYLCRKWAGGAPVNLNFEGDSQTQGANILAGDDQDTYPARLFASLAEDRIAIRNNATSGATWATLESRSATVDGCISSKGKNILCVWCGTNEAGANDAPASVAAATSYLADRAAAGWDLVVLTAMDRTDASNEPWRTAYNSALRALCTDEGYHLADIAASPLIGGAGDYADTTYFQVDGIHLNATGRGVAAAIVHDVLSPLVV
jgi:lysophospholipase L1-like esterase